MEKKLEEAEQNTVQIITVPVSLWISCLTGGYVLFLAVLLPLYHRNGYELIGDRKYRLFFVVTLVVMVLGGLLGLIKRLPSFGKLPIKTPAKIFTKTFREKKWTLTDLAVLCYIGAVLVSFLGSNYKKTALFGYPDWHMGVITQLMFAAIYFLVSRAWTWNKREVFCLMLGSFLVALLGLFNRFGIDPLGMLAGLEYWNKTHLLSTIGNINWYCGYLCAIFPLGIAWFLAPKTGKHKKRDFLISSLYAAVLFATLMTQGSTSGIFTLGVLFFLTLLYVIKEKKGIINWPLMNALLGITVGVLGMVFSTGNQENFYFAKDLAIDVLITKKAWWYYGLVSIFAVGLVSVWRKNRKREFCERNRDFKFGKLPFHFARLPGLLAIGILVGSLQPMTDSFGSGRGYLWRISWKAYCTLPLFRQLIGVGPDCFAPFLYSHFSTELTGFLGEWWGNARVANAHSEWLNTLVNCGALGLTAYGNIFIAGLRDCGRKMKELKNTGREKGEKGEQQGEEQRIFLLGVFLCIIAYGVNASVSFQQVMATPYLFLLMGMSQAVIRRNDTEITKENKLSV